MLGMSLVGILICMYSHESLAFAEPIIRKVNDAQRNLIRIGKVITALSFVISLIMFVLGQPQWKWCGYIIVGGAILTSIDPVLRWISH